MENIKENIADNITKLRKANGYSQAELGEKLNYSDKVISKWERMESTPDVNSLYEMSKVFNVSIEYFFQPHELIENGETVKKRDMRKHYAVMGLVISAIWLIAITAFVYPYLAKISPNGYWLSLIWALPLSMIVCLRFGVTNRLKYWRVIFTSLLLWTLLLAIYLTVYVVGYKQAYMMFIIGAPLQAVIILMEIIKS